MNVREEKKVVSLTKTGELTLNNGNYGIGFNNYFKKK